jgi:ribosome-associated protein
MRRRDDQPESAGEEAPSKSELKRRMLALQQLGEALVELSDKQLETVPVEDERLLEAIREAREMRSHSARRRHLQLIGKLMRDIDAGPIENAMQSMDNRRRENASSFHQLEKLRDEVLAAGASGTELVVERWPQADRQQLRQLILQHQRENKLSKPPVASRKLFRLLRELTELYGDAG